MPQCDGYAEMNKMVWDMFFVISDELKGVNVDEVFVGVFDCTPFSTKRLITPSK